MIRGQSVTLRNTVDGRLEFVGMKFQGPISVLHQTDNRVLLKVAGGMDWCGIGMQEYYPTLYLLFEVIVSGEKSHQLRFIKEEEPGRRWKKVLDSMIKEMENG